VPLRPNLLERVLLHKGVIPSVLLDTGVSMFQASALLTAGDVRLFNHLQERPLTIEELKIRTACSLHGLQVLLTCMMNLGYVDLRGSHYALTPATRRSFPVDLFPEMVPFFRAVNEKLNNATFAVLTDPPGGIMGWNMVTSGPVGRSYQAAMRWLGSSIVKEAGSRIRIADPPRRMLDVGGSHGLYSVEFCRKHPHLKATVLDWPIGLESARLTLAEARDVAERIDLLECDFEKESIPKGDYDFFLGNIIHGLNEEANQRLFANIAAASSKVATIAILDQYSNVTGSAFVKGVASLIGWNLFLFAGGRAYDFDDVTQWLDRAGFRSTTLAHLRRSPGFSLITAQKH
jgi:hypothetical protein